MKFCITVSQTADLVTFTDEICRGKLHFLCSVLRGFFSANRGNGSDILSKNQTQNFENLAMIE